MKKIILTLLLSAIVPFILMADPPKKSNRNLYQRNFDC